MYHDSCERAHRPSPSPLIYTLTLSFTRVRSMIPEVIKLAWFDSHYYRTPLRSLNAAPPANQNLHRKS